MFRSSMFGRTWSLAVHLIFFFLSDLSLVLQFFIDVHARCQMMCSIWIPFDVHTQRASERTKATDSEQKRWKERALVFVWVRARVDVSRCRFIISLLRLSFLSVVVVVVDVRRPSSRRCLIYFRFFSLSPLNSMVLAPLSCAQCQWVDQPDDWPMEIKCYRFAWSLKHTRCKYPVDAVVICFALSSHNYYWLLAVWLLYGALPRSVVGVHEGVVITREKISEHIELSRNAKTKPKWNGFISEAREHEQRTKNRTIAQYVFGIGIAYIF